MALIVKAPRTSVLSALGMSAAALVPLLYTLSCARAYGDVDSSLRGLLDGYGTGSGASFQLGSIGNKLCALLPLGPLSMRGVLASGLWSALSTCVLYRTIDLLLRAQGVRHDSLVTALSLGLSLFIFGSPQLMSHALLPAGFALQSLLALTCLWRLTRLEASFPTHDLRPLYGAALAFGLCAANDPCSALVLLLSALPTLSRVLHAKGPAPLLRALGFALLCLGAVLAARGLHGFSHAPALAEAARKPLGAAFWLVPLTLLQRFSSALGLFGLLAGLGAVAALQTPGVRRIAQLWLCALIAPLLGYGFIGTLPDAAEGLGMLAFMLPASALLAAALPGALLAPDGHGKPVVSRAQLGAVLCFLLVGVLRMHESAVTERDNDPSFLDSLGSISVEELPPRALVLLRDPQLALPLMAAEAERALRPDVELLSSTLLDHAASAHGLVAHTPMLKPLLRSYLLDGDFSAPELESLAAKRPVLLDMTPATDPALHEALRPSHLLFEVTGAGLRRSEQRAAAANYHDQLAALNEELRAEPGTPSITRYLAWNVLAVTLYFASTGDRLNARLTTEDGRALAPKLPLWDLLATALGPETAKGSVDVHTFVTEPADLPL